jgi:hypothetical protein
MTDPDDVDAILLTQAVDGLRAISHQYSDPDYVLQEWLRLVIAHLITPGPRPDLWRLLTLCARSVTLDAIAAAPAPITIV